MQPKNLKLPRPGIQREMHQAEKNLHCLKQNLLKRKRQEHTSALSKKSFQGRLQTFQSFSNISQNEPANIHIFQPSQQANYATQENEGEDSSLDRPSFRREPTARSFRTRTHATIVEESEVDETGERDTVYNTQYSRMNTEQNQSLNPYEDPEPGSRDNT